MSSLPTLISTISVNALLQMEGTYHFSTKATSFISRVNPDVKKGHAFIYVDPDGNMFCCELKEETVDLYEYTTGIYNKEKRKDGRRGIICKGKEVQQEIKNSIMWGKW